MSQPPPRLLLVYNADRGIINALMQAVHKQVSPGTYPCSLCAITYGAVSMDAEWRRFLAGLPVQVVIHHKDDFEEAYPGHGAALPAILIAHDGAPPRVLLSAERLDAVADTIELIESVKDSLASENISVPKPHF